MSKPKGFAAIPKERVSEIASMGGIAAHRVGTAHEFTPEEARAAGRKGGIEAHRRRRERKAQQEQEASHPKELTK